MTVAYLGGGFRGFAVNRDVRTVAGVLGEAMALVLGGPVEIRVAGRTDAGVHAWGQVVSFDAPDSVDLVGLQRRLNSMLGPEVVVRDIAEAVAGFDARRWALARRYHYTILNRPVPDPFLATTTWHVPTPLSLPAMRLACDPLIGQHDFASFCRVEKRRPEASLVRRVIDARWVEPEEGILRFEIEATSFCQQMVRSVVGTMVEMGFGRMRAGEMAGILAARDRSLAGHIAPALGLCLRNVTYPD